MKAKKLNLIVVILITLFMGYLLLFTDRSGTDIAIAAIAMALLNSGVPVNMIVDKLIELKKLK